MRLFFLVGLVVFSLLLVLLAMWALAGKRSQQVSFEERAWRAELSERRFMIKDLVENRLPDKSRSEIEEMLGRSPTHDEMRRYTQEDLQQRDMDEQGRWKPFQRSGEGFYFDECEWDLIYAIGRQNHGVSPDEEYFVVRVDSNDVFASWFIVGAPEWHRTIGSPALQTFRPRR